MHTGCRTSWAGLGLASFARGLEPCCRPHAVAAAGVPTQQQRSPFGSVRRQLQLKFGPAPSPRLKIISAIFELQRPLPVPETQTGLHTCQWHKQNCTCGFGCEYGLSASHVDTAAAKSSCTWAVNEPVLSRDWPYGESDFVCEAIIVPHTCAPAPLCMPNTISCLHMRRVAPAASPLLGLPSCSEPIRRSPMQQTR